MEVVPPHRKVHTWYGSYCKETANKHRDDSLWGSARKTLCRFYYASINHHSESSSAERNSLWLPDAWDGCLKFTQEAISSKETNEKQRSKKDDSIAWGHYRQSTAYKCFTPCGHLPHHTCQIIISKKEKPIKRGKILQLVLRYLRVICVFFKLRRTLKLYLSLHCATQHHLINIQRFCFGKSLIHSSSGTRRQLKIDIKVIPM